MIRKFIQFILLVLPIMLLAQSPGGVGNPEVWLKADAGISTTGNDVTTWNNSGTSGGAATPISTGFPDFVNSLHNFNPAVVDNTTGVHDGLVLQNAYPSYTHRNLYTFVIQSQPDVTQTRTMISYGNNAVSSSSQDEPWFASQSVSSFRFFWQSSYQPTITFPNSLMRYNGVPTINAYYAPMWVSNPHTVTTSMNGATNTGAGNSNAGAGFGQHLFIHGDGGHNNISEGNISEIISFGRTLTAQEINQINSYLAIKYGITLLTNDGISVNDYINSNANEVWGATTTNTGYNNNIFGIGRDVVSGLNQKQSKSVNANQKLIIGAGTGLFDTNAENTNSLTDGQYFMVGDNGLAQRLSVPVTGNPNVNFRFESVWKVQNTNTVGQVTIAWPQGINNLHLVQSSDETFATGNTFTSMATEVTVNGVVYNTATVTLTQGQFFTLAGFEYAPGGVKAAAWYRADATGTVFSDAGVTNATDNVAAQQWNEFLGTGHNLTQNSAGARPIFSSETVLANFNPTMTFNGNHDMTYQPATGVNIIDRVNGSLFTAGYFNLLEGTGIFGFDATADYPGLHTSNDATRDKLLFYTGGPGYQGVSEVGFASNKFFVAGANWQNGAGTNASYASSTVSLDGQRTIYNGSQLQNAVINDGSRDITIGGDSNYGDVDGQVNEAIIFEEALTAGEMDRVESYLAIKYGTTLVDRNYTNSTTSVVWDASANVNYNNNIFGIGRDDVSALYQKQSRSTNADQKLIIGAGTGLFNTNAANTNTLAEGQFVMVGDNGLEQSLKAPLVKTGGSNGETNLRFESIWKVENPGGVGVVTVAWPKSFNNMYLVTSSDATIDATDTFVPMTTEVTVNGVVYNTAEVTLGTGSYFTLAGFAYAPGGVVGPDFWVRSDDAGDISTAWKDHSVNVDNIPAVGTWALSPADRAHNFHPYTSGFSTTKNFHNPATLLNPGGGDNPTSYAIFSSVRPTTFADGRITGIGTNGGVGYGSNPSIAMRSNGLPNFYEFETVTTSQNFSTPFILNRTNLFSVNADNSVANGGISTFSGGQINLGLNGLYETSTYTNANEFLFSGPNLRVGYSTYGDANGVFSGDIMEVVWYKRNLTAQEQSQVNSYLAVKNGVTLNENYLNTVGATVWDRNLNTGYNNNIFGIAKDALTALDQKQSGSVNSGQKLVISTTGFADSNAANTTSIATDIQYLITGDNGLTQSLSTPFVYSGANGNTNSRFAAVWKVQKTAGVGTVTVAWPKGVSNLYLVQSSDPTFATGNSYAPMATEVTVNGVVYNTANVNLTEDYFTFAGFVHAPGGVTTNLARWYRTDIGATLDVDKVSALQDQVSGTETIVQTTATRMPLFNTGANSINFNPNMEFTPNPHTALNSLTGGYASGTNGLTSFSVAVPNANQLAQRKYIFGITNVSQTGAGANENDRRLAVGNVLTTNGTQPQIGEFRNGDAYASNGAWTAGLPTIIKAGSNPAPDNQTFFLSQNGNTAVTGTGLQPMNYVETGFGLGSGGDNHNDTGVYGWDGKIGEVILYAGGLSPMDQRKVDSYLAIKYGITLDASNDYLSAAHTIWNATDAAYYHNIAGIGYDFISALHQKQSRSINPGQKLILGAGTSLFETNAANTNTLNDGQFFVVGDNGLAQSLKVPLSYTAGSNGDTNFRFESVWKVKNTNNVGTVTVAWPKGVRNLYVVKSTDDNFDSADSFIEMTTEVTVNGVVYNTAEVTMADGNFFTFAGFGYAPGGVANALSYWYRADMDATNTGVGTDVTGWTDVWSGTVSAQISTADLPKFAEGAANYFNFNPGINFTAGTQKIGNINVQTFSALNYDIFTFTKEGMATGGTRSRFFNVGRNNTTMGADNWDSPGFLINGNIVRRTSTGGDLTEYNVNPKFSTTIPSISYHTFTDLNFSRGLNGETNGANLTHSTRGMMTGGHIFGDNRNPGTGGDDAGFIGHLGETIIYGSGNLTAEERRRVDSYMAIKYGITLARVNTDHYLGSTASSTSIVWNGATNATYNNNIFGMARADIGGFEQKVSKSVNAGTILTIAKNNDFVLPNDDASRTGLPVDEGYLLLGDNNVTTTTAAPAPAIGACGEDLGNGLEFRMIPRKWMVQRTNDIGITYLQANLAAYAASINSEIVMLVADDADFTQNVVAVQGTNDANNWTFAHNFDNETAVRYITFGGTFVTAPCEQCKGGSYTLRTGYQWNQNLTAWANQIANEKLNVTLGNDADGNPLTASMYANYSDPNVEYQPNRYPRQYGGRWTTARRYDNTAATDSHVIELSQAMKASFQISNINTYRNNKNNFEVIGYCNGGTVLPTITYAYNTSYHTFEIENNETIGTMSWRGFVPNVSTANVRFDRPVERIEIISSVERVNADKTLRSILYSDITLECAEVLEPTPDNVYVSHSFTQDTLATCGGETTMRIKVTNNNLCEDKTISLHQLLPSGLQYVPDSFNGNDLPAGTMDNATLTYSGSSFELSGLTLPRGEHWMYIDVANPGAVGTYPTQFTFEVTDGVDPAFTYSSSIVDLNYYESTEPQLAAPSLELSIKDNVSCGENGDEITYRMKIDNPNVGGISGAEILHMFDYDQLIESVTFVTGEDEDGVVSGTYPVDGSSTSIDPVGNNIFNLVDATIPEGISYIDITVNVGNSYDIPEVQALGISSSFIVAFGSGECAESAELISNEVELRLCSACTKPGATGTALTSSVGILTKAETSVVNWPESVPNGYLVLDGAFKGMVITHMTTAEIDALTPVEGMLVFDTDESCVKLYRGAGANAPVVHPSRQGWVCIERVCID